MSLPPLLIVVPVQQDFYQVPDDTLMFSFDMFGLLLSTFELLCEKLRSSNDVLNDFKDDLSVGLEVYILKLINLFHSVFIFGKTNYTESLQLMLWSEFV